MEWGELFGKIFQEHSGEALLFLLSCLILLSLLSLWMWEYAHRRELFHPEITTSFVRHSELRALSLAIVFGLSIPVAIFIGPGGAELTWILVVPARAMLRRRYGSIHEMVW